MVSVDQYLQDIQEEKDAAIAAWGDSIDPIGKDVINGAYSWMLENLNITGGRIELTPSLTSLMNDFLQSIVTITTNSKQYKDSLTNYLASIDQIRDNMVKLHNQINDINIEDVLKVTQAQKIVVNEIINKYSENGLNDNFAAPLRDIIYRNALAGQNMKEIKSQLQQYILGGSDKSGKLGSYLTQTAQQGADSYTGAINMQIKKNFTVIGFIISGSIIETSSVQCIDAVSEAKKGFLDNDQWEKILVIAANNPKARLIAGTTLDNLSLNKLHWGCRHEFTPIVSK